MKRFLILVLAGFIMAPVVVLDSLMDFGLYVVGLLVFSYGVEQD